MSKQKKAAARGTCNCKKKIELENLVSTLQDDIEKYSVEARLKEDLKEMKILLTKANSFRELVLKSKY